jgi:carbon storage regulator CsrA
VLVLSRKQKQSLRVGNITIHVVKFGRNRVSLGIDAPPGVRVVRSELADRPVPPPIPHRDRGRQHDQASAAGLFRVVLIDAGYLRVAYECDSRSEANAWVEEWDRDALGIVAIVWPRWAPLSLAATLCPLAAESEVLA